MERNLQKIVLNKKNKMRNKTPVIPEDPSQGQGLTMTLSSSSLPACPYSRL